MIEAIKQVWFILREEPIYFFPVIYSVVSVLFMIYFSVRTFEKMWSRMLGATVISFVIIAFSYSLLSPESTYEDIKKRNDDITFTLKNCKVSAFEAQQAGFLDTAKDAWSCPDGVTRYLPVKYRDKGRQYNE